MNQIKRLCHDVIWESYFNNPKNLSNIILPNISIENEIEILNLNARSECLVFSDSKNNSLYYFSSVPIENAIQNTQMTIILKLYRIIFESPSNSLGSKIIKFPETNLLNLNSPYLLAIFGHKEQLQEMALTGVVAIPLPSKMKNIAA